MYAFSIRTRSDTLVPWNVFLQTRLFFDRFTITISVLKINWSVKTSWHEYWSVMRRSIRKFNIPPPWATPRAFELLKIGLFKFPPLGARKLFKCPTNYYWTTSPQDKFRLQSNTLHAFQREICRNDTFKLLLKTLLKGWFTNKGEILSCKSVKPSKKSKKLRGVLRQNKR